MTKHAGGTVERFSIQRDERDAVRRDTVVDETRMSKEDLRQRAEAIRQRALEQWASWEHVPQEAEYDGLELRLAELRKRIARGMVVAKKLVDAGSKGAPREIVESRRLLEGEARELENIAKPLKKAPYVMTRGESAAHPRVLAIAEGYMSAVEGAWSAETLAVYLAEMQRHDVLLLCEAYLLESCLKLVLMEHVVERLEATLDDAGRPAAEFHHDLERLKKFTEHDWELFVESLVAFHAILARDPDGVYLRMEAENRGAYRQRVAELAKFSDANEMHTAQIALEMAVAAARKPAGDARLAKRTAHVGYYLFEEGLPQLKRAIGHRPNAVRRVRNWLRSDSEIYILAIYILTLVIIAAIMMPLVSHREILPVIVTLFIALLPATQGAADLVNDIVTSLFTPRILPKLDFSDGVPAEQSAFVAVPTLLINEAQMMELFEDLEIRYLANMDPNLHFGLLTDLPDSITQPSPADRNDLVEKAAAMVDRLNKKYAGQGGGAFLLLHRHRIYNVMQGVWMGWERKRGKLLDLNKLLMDEFDSFPVKAGPVEVLKRVRYVITLDTDTQLPGGTAARMVGAMAHPLNQAIIDPKKQIVTAGYGILQPRVGVSFASVSRSRFATLYSGETGYDIYTRAVSDVYQDLFGEGSFTGKGIYEVSIFHQVLNHRFPNNALLSHDLIEGTYARAGLVTDIEVLDDYPSQYSTHTRRKHRWVRGDWQIIHWLFSLVPDESNKLVRNPINAISKWKILDNLRRSLIEPITMVLLVLGWFMLPGGAFYWTAVTLLLLLFPSIIQLGFNLARVVVSGGAVTVGQALQTFGSSFSFSLLNLAFLPHQTMLSLDAIIRSMFRRFVTGMRLLEWETAAQTEAGVADGPGRSSTSLDLYLKLTPLVALGIAIPLGMTHLRAIFSAGPILLLWAIAPSIANWLSAPPHVTEEPLDADGVAMLHDAAFDTWRYFAEFGGEKYRWLIPDNVREDGLVVTGTLTPTNIGLLLNARQAAVEMGFLTAPEFARATLGSLRSYDQIEKFNGHIFNWNDLETLKPMAPVVVSTVDSGNLRGSLFALHGGAVEIMNASLLPDALFISLDRLLQRYELIPAKLGLARFLKGERTSAEKNVRWLLSLPELKGCGTELSGPVREALERKQQLEKFIEEYLPWLLPEFDGVRAEFADWQEISPAGLLREMRSLDEMDASGQKFLQRLMEARSRLRKLYGELKEIAALAEKFAREMRFDFLYNSKRVSLAVDYDVSTGVAHRSGYTMLASESRMAVFLAVANGEIPQKTWFRLSRVPVLVEGQATLMSWTGTMFEYLMPTLWMKSYPQTLMFSALKACVRVQQMKMRGRPWGISESSYAERDENGQYKYYAWGIEQLALKNEKEPRVVISPYSSFLALPFGARAAVENLRRMMKLGWRGEFGFYEAADYEVEKNPEVVRQWMAHHQGMTLLAITNELAEGAVQRWFHANPCVRAIEYLLNERPFTPQVINVLKKRQAELPAA